MCHGFYILFMYMYVFIICFRVGSQFQLRYGVSTGGLGDPITMGTISNNSLLFQTSERTAFLFGGLPEGAQVRLVFKNSSYSA